MLHYVCNKHSYFYSDISIMLGAGEEVQHPEQEPGQADKVLKAHREQLQLVKEIKEIEREMESLGNTFTFELSSTPEARDKLGKIQVHCMYVIIEII